MKDKTKGIAVHAMEFFYSLAVLAWFFLPLFIKTPLEIHPFLFIPSFTGLPGVRMEGLSFFSLSVFLIPLICAAKMFAPFLKKALPFLFEPDSYFARILNFINSGFIIGICFFFTLRDAGVPEYFRTIDVFTYGVFILSAGLNVFQVVSIIRKLRARRADFREFSQLKSEYRGGENKFTGKEVLGGVSIRHKLLVSFVVTILVIIILLLTVLMADYKNTIVADVIANGTTLADQTVSFIKENLSGNVDIKTFMDKQKKKNLHTTLRYDSLSFYEKQQATNKYIVTSSTNGELLGRELPEGDGSLEDIKTRYLPEAAVYRIIAPIFLGNRESSIKKAGFAVVEYNEDVIYESYFRSQVRVTILCFLVIYLSLLLIYVIGGNIVYPLLYLQMNVKRISAKLMGMLNGRDKITSVGLSYNDAVLTHDEIKVLSVEIERMVSVIRGVIPYISESTFRQSENKGGTSMIKDQTYLFTDIRGFTTLCEGKTPDQIMDILNRYLDIQSQVIRNNGGDIDKFIGDAVMAVFDGPDKEYHACKSGMEIRLALQLEKEKRTTLHEAIVEVGIGIHTGEAVFGSVGTKGRKDFTCIGDNVNLAARLEGANKAYGTKTLVSEAVHEKVGKKFLCREIDLMTVKGKKKPVMIYEILNETDKALPRLRLLKTNFEKGLAAYRNRDWDSAIGVFESNVRDFDDEPSKVFITRCKLFKKNPPPEEWEGVFSLTSK
jgi:adenylate cyclase